MAKRSRHELTHAETRYQALIYELKLLTLFCRVVYRDEMNKQNFRFKIEKPASQNEAICISFIDPVELDPMPKREEDDSW